MIFANFKDATQVLCRYKILCQNPLINIDDFLYIQVQFRALKSEEIKQCFLFHNEILPTIQFRIKNERFVKYVNV